MDCGKKRQPAPELPITLHPATLSVGEVEDSSEDERIVQYLQIPWLWYSRKVERIIKIRINGKLSTSV